MSTLALRAFSNNLSNNMSSNPYDANYTKSSSSSSFSNSNGGNNNSAGGGGSSSASGNMNAGPSAVQIHPGMMPYVLGQGGDAMAERRVKDKDEANRRAAARQIRLICKSCRNPEPNIVEEIANGDLVCGDCGLVLGDRVVDTRSEWRSSKTQKAVCLQTFANDDGPDQSRVGNGPSGEALLEGREDFSTEISFQDGNTGYAARLQRTQSMMVGSKSDSKRQAGHRMISELADKLGIDKRTMEAAKQIWIICQDNIEDAIKTGGKKPKYGKGANPDLAMAGGCVFIGCREQKVTRTLKEVCDACRIPKGDLGHSYSTIKRMLMQRMASGLRSVAAYEAPLSAQSGRATELLPRFCHQLAVGTQMEYRARHIIERAGENSQGMVDGRSPTSVAAGAIFFACLLFGVPVTMKEIAEIAQVSETTIRLIASIFARHKEELTDPKWIAKDEINYDNIAFLTARRNVAANGAAAAQ